jgi:uracil-DNA glycosylase
LENYPQPLDSLRWYAQMGVDLCIELEPQEIVASTAPITVLYQGAAPQNAIGGLPHESPAETNRSLEFVRPKASVAVQPSIADAVAEARTLADAATNLDELEAAVRIFNGCSLKKTATNTVFAQGVATSRLMFIGEAPGAEEDRNGVPFCGPSGQLLDKMLSFIGLNRAENFYITNCLFWRPPGNRQPSADELDICRPLVEKHIALVNPKTIVLVGGTATSAILRDTRGITRLRGQIFSYKNDYMAEAVPVHVIYHPSYLLRQPAAKKQAWADLLALKAALSA